MRGGCRSEDDNGRIGYHRGRESRLERRSNIKDNINWRRHRTACPFYREDWNVEGALYRCICLLDMPPVTREEQDLCMKSRNGCWRFKKKAAKPAALRAS